VSAGIGSRTPILAVTHGETQDLAAAVAAHPGGHQHRLSNDSAVDPCFAVGGVHEHMGEGLSGQRAVPEALTSASKSAQIRLTLDLLMPLSAPRARTRSSTLRVLTPGKYASITTANNAWSTRRRRSNKRGEERPRPQLGDPQLQIPGRGRQQPRAVAVALGQPLGRALVGAAPITAVSSASMRAW
jgi:hypothetical protein